MCTTARMPRAAAPSPTLRPRLPVEPTTISRSARCARSFGSSARAAEEKPAPRGSKTDWSSDSRTSKPPKKAFARCAATLNTSNMPPRALTDPQTARFESALSRQRPGRRPSARPMASMRRRGEETVPGSPHGGLVTSSGKSRTKRGRSHAHIRTLASRSARESTPQPPSSSHAGFSQHTGRRARRAAVVASSMCGCALC
mmetsp:Transcript_7228/g.23709  ORF Transcript_7228/g.23709 Transcript_7228/m.23709 type:complete len:200 (-) Transcript_7228:2-601(-)